MTDKNTCKTCRYYDAGADTTGLCRKSPPTFEAMADNSRLGYWPRTRDGDWCGEWAKEGEGNE